MKRTIDILNDHGVDEAFLRKNDAWNKIILAMQDYAKQVAEAAMHYSGNDCTCASCIANKKRFFYNLFNEDLKKIQ
jgi:hypothetical protein